jgi:signal transduction histidine kinase
MLRRPTTPILATVILSGTATVLVTALPGLDFAYRQLELHVGLETAAALIGLLASYLLLGRFRRRRRLDDLALVGMNLKRLDDKNEHVRRAMAGVERGLADARAAISTLRSPVDEPVDVVLARVAREVAAREGTEVALALAPGVETSSEVRDAFARILSETIANAARGRADLVHVGLENGRRLPLCVRDSGTGFDSGLGTLREQAMAVGAEVRVRTVEGSGTEIEVVL